MKVLYILNTSEPFCGANKSFISLLRELMNKGVEPLVIIPTDNGIVAILNDLQVKYIVLPLKLWVYPESKKLSFLPRLLAKSGVFLIDILRIANIARKCRIDMIHTNVGPIHSGYHAARCLNIPHVWHVREYQDLDFGLKPMFSKACFIKKLNNNGNHSVVITNGIRDHFSILTNHKVINDGVLYAKQAKTILSKEKYFLFAGRLEEGKGIRDLLIAFNQFCEKEKDYKLLVAGDTTDVAYKDELKSIAEYGASQGKVDFLGMRTDVYDLMARASALIVPSHSEGFGMITAEAMFNGCLVIGYNNAGTQEILKKDNLGILYNTSQGLIDAMLQVVEDPSKYTSTICKAQKIAVERYSIENYGIRVFDFYKEIMNK